MKPPLQFIKPLEWCSVCRKYHPAWPADAIAWVDPDPFKTPEDVEELREMVERRKALAEKQRQQGRQK